MTDDPIISEELLELGKQVAADCVDFTRHGRPVTNIEMYAATMWQVEERRKAELFLEDEL